MYIDFILRIHSDLALFKAFGESGFFIPTSFFVPYRGNNII